MAKNRCAQIEPHESMARLVVMCAQIRELTLQIAVEAQSHVP
jgi:hypothetical protein